MPKSRASLWIAGWVIAFAVAGPAAGAEVRVSFQFEGLPVEAEAQPVEIVARSGGGASQEPIEGQVPGSKVLHLEPGKFWTVSALAKGLWSESVVVFVPPEGVDAAIRLWPTGTLLGRVELDEREKVPEALEVRFQPEAKRETEEPAEERQGPAGAISCPVLEKQFACELPAGGHDVRIGALPFVSHYRFGLAIAAGQEAPVGALNLFRGASLVGWVEAEGPLPGERTVIRLVPQTARSSEGPAGERVGQLAMEARPSRRGFFQFEGVSPGRYEVVAEGPGYAPARASGVEVAADRETALDQPLRLEPFREVEVVLDPSVDPWGARWIVGILDMNSVPLTFDAIGEETATEEGRATFHLARGNFLLTVSSGAGEGWFEEEIQVAGDSLKIPVRLAVVPVSGTVTLGGEPLEATVIYGGRYSSQSMVLASDEETGEYRGVLPRSGTWRVEVLGVLPPVKRSLEGVLVEPKPGKEEALVDFELPGTRLAGEVVDELGKPIHDFIVEMSIPGEEESEAVRQRVEDPDGQFEIFGLPEGDALVRAEAPEGASDRVNAVLSEEADAPFLRLVIKDLIEVNARVVDEQGRGVPGAEVTVRGMGQVHFWAPLYTTEADGSFEVELPGEETEALVSILAPGYALRVFRTAISAENELVIPVARTSGSLEINFPAALDFDTEPLLGLFLFHRGGSIGVNRAHTWARMISGEAAMGSQVRIPALEAGGYHLCRLSQVGIAMALAGNFPQDKCSSGVVAEGGVLSLEVPPIAPGGGEQ